MVLQDDRKGKLSFDTVLEEAYLVDDANFVEKDPKTLRAGSIPASRFSLYTHAQSLSPRLPLTP